MSATSQLSAAASKGEPEVLVDINTTPLIDVMLVLLIMFIVTVPIQTHSIRMALPAPDAAASPPPALPALRIDVAEELSRLQAHLQEIRRLLQQGGELGKRLDFLIQELHREANTLGSKSAALELTGLSVDMKVAIEQMREQVQNIE